MDKFLLRKPRESAGQPTASCSYSSTSAPPPGLPDPRDEDSLFEAEECEAANAAVASISNSRKRGKYTMLSDEVRMKIARHSILNGPVRTAKHFTAKLGFSLNESTVRSIRDKYRKSGAAGRVAETLPRGKRGGQLLLGQDLDEAVQRRLRKIRSAGGVINRTIVLAVAKGLASKRNIQVPQNGSQFDRPWAASIMRRMNLVKRKGTKAAKTLPENFEQKKKDYLSNIVTTVQSNQIPESIVINIDQTGLSVVPTSDWTMDVRGSKQVPVVAKGDKRQITALLGCSLTGDLLPLQLVYSGKTDRCHPDHVKFPPSWSISHSESHWSNEDTMKEYVEKVLVPYFAWKRERLELDPEQKALCILDVFKAHRTKGLIDLMAENNILLQFVPACCTGDLQPLDLSGNATFKDLIKGHFTAWYADQVPDDDDSDFNVDLRMATVKPLHAKWVIKSWDTMRREYRTCLIAGWQKAGIVDALKVDMETDIIV